MSQENVEILLAASKAASDGATVEERESFLTILDPEIEWIATAGGPADLAGNSAVSTRPAITTHAGGLLGLSGAGK